MSDEYNVAVDIGSTKVCTIITRKRADHRVEVRGLGLVPCTGMDKGMIVDSVAVTESVQNSIKMAASRAEISVSNVHIGLTGSHIESINRWSKVPRLAGMRSVTDSDLLAAKKIAGAIDLGDDRKLLHVIPRSYALDGLHGVRNPIGMHTGELHVESHVITGSISKINELKKAVDKAGVKVSSLVVEPLASADAVLTADEREQGAVMVDVGGGTSDIAVYQNGTVVHTAVIPVGGYQFSNDLAIAFSLDFDSAEQLKIQHGTAAPELAGMHEEITLNPQSMDQSIKITKREIGQVLKERASELFRMILLKLDEPHLMDIPIDRIVFTGGGAKLEGFLNIAKFIFQRKVRIATPRGIEGMSHETNDPTYSAAAGIALWGIKTLQQEKPMVYLKSSATAQKKIASTRSPNLTLSRIRNWLPKREKEPTSV